MTDQHSYIVHAENSQEIVVHAESTRRIRRHVTKYIPSLREAIEARPGFVFSSEDYKAGELVTHAQSCVWITGKSDLGIALRAGVDPHAALASTVLGIDYKQFNKKIKQHANARQAAKPFMFGKPGGMGDVKLVLQQRKQGPDTPHPDGPIWIKDDSGNRVRGYKGLRFCVIMNTAARCGEDKVTEWRERPIPPTCRACIECAVGLSRHWKEQWSENPAYFAFINECVNDGMLITRQALERWPHLAEVFTPGQRLAPGEIMQHVSGRVRGGLEYCACCNTFFQGLLADIAKAALRRISWECYDNTIKVPSMLHANSLRSAYAGNVSPLLGSRVIVFQHDEVIAEHPESVAHDAATRVSEVMRDCMRAYCPDMADAAEAEPTLMRRWYKGAAKKVDSNGRLVPWEPEGAKP